MFYGEGPRSVNEQIMISIHTLGEQHGDSMESAQLPQADERPGRPFHSPMNRIHSKVLMGLAAIGIVFHPGCRQGESLGDDQFPQEKAEKACIPTYIYEMDAEHDELAESSDDKIVRRKGRVYVINKRKPKHKQRQG